MARERFIFGMGHQPHNGLRAMTDLRGLLASADELRVDAIAQEPFCVDPSRGDLKSTYDEARARGFEYLPVRDSDGMIRRVVPTEVLANADWTTAQPHAVLLNADQLVARDAPAFSL